MSCLGSFSPGSGWPQTGSIDQQSSTEVGQKNIAMTTSVDSIYPFEIGHRDHEAGH
jgi:hypothetical protein